MSLIDKAALTGRGRRGRVGSRRPATAEPGVRGQRRDRRQGVLAVATAISRCAAVVAGCPVAASLRRAPSDGGGEPADAAQGAAAAAIPLTRCHNRRRTEHPGTSASPRTATGNPRPAQPPSPRAVTAPATHGRDRANTGSHADGRLPHSGRRQRRAPHPPPAKPAAPPSGPSTNPLCAQPGPPGRMPVHSRHRRLRPSAPAGWGLSRFRRPPLPHRPVQPHPPPRFRRRPPSRQRRSARPRSEQARPARGQAPASSPAAPASPRSDQPRPPRPGRAGQSGTAGPGRNRPRGMSNRTHPSPAGGSLPCCGPAIGASASERMSPTWVGPRPAVTRWARIPGPVRCLPARANIVPYPPSEAGGALFSVRSDPTGMAPGTGFAVLSAWAAAAVVVGAVLLRRRDA